MVPFQQPAGQLQAALTLGRRTALGGLTALMAPAVLRHHARASTPTRLRFLTSWTPQAEHGGFFQAQAAGHYARAGLDIVLQAGGPQVNGLQFLLSGAVDLILGFDIQVLKSVTQGIPVVVVASSFQQDLQGLMTHQGITGIAGLTGHRILLSSAAYSTFWPWLRKRYGFTDAQTGVFTFNLQPFLIDQSVAVQAYATSEPFEAQKAGGKVNFFPLYSEGYPPYANPIVTTNDLVARQPDAVAAFVHASMLGWRDYLRDPSLGNTLIQSMNPQMTQDRLDYAVAQMRSRGVVTGGDAATHGIGVITEARWQRTAAFLVQNQLLPAATDWRRGFTTRFVDAAPVLPG